MQLQAPRYCDVPFPAYRFIPGQNPHPTADPAGHSYRPPGEPEPQVAYRSAEQWRDSTAYLYGCDLYNHGYWWEAHEAWESLWQLLDKTAMQARFLQSLIQVGARHLKLHMHMGRGVDSLGLSSAGHIHFVLEQLSDDYLMGLDYRGWTRRVDAYYQALQSGPDQPPAHDPRRYPYILLDGP